MENKLNDMNTLLFPTFSMTAWAAGENYYKIDVIQRVALHHRRFDILFSCFPTSQCEPEGKRN